MKKNNIPKAENTKKSNVSAQNKQEKKSKKESKTTIEYPLWTMPDHLHEKDHRDLKRVYELFKESKFELALSYASDLDTIVREEIPADIWQEIGEIINVENSDFPEEEKPDEQVQTAEKEEKAEQTDLEIQLVIKNVESSNESRQIIEAKLHDKNELYAYFLQNHKSVFGENTVIIDNTKNTDEYFPDMFLIDSQEKEKPRLYVIEQYLQDDSMSLLYARITHFIASLTNKKYQNDFLCELINVVNANDNLKIKLKSRLNEEQDIQDFLSDILDNKPAILLLKTSENTTLNLMQMVYAQTWGKIVRQILFKKYFGEGETIFELSPPFTDIWKSEKQKTLETIKVSENDHLCELPDRIRNIYRSIKTALLELDNNLEFNPKKHYISIRKGKNLAFLHLRRKQADIVVMNPEENTRELIKHHRIKSLPASVQKFWNGDCCTIVVENADNLEEVIEVLKIVIEKV